MHLVYSLPMRFTLGMLGIFLVATGCFPAKATRDAAPEAGDEPEKESRSLSPIRVVVIGDRTGGHDDGLFSKTIGEAARLRPDLLLSVGDLIEGYQPDDRLEEADAEWDHVLAMLQRAFGEIPLYVAAGNHDVWSEKSEELFEKRVGHRVNYSFAVGPVRFILLDSSRIKSEIELPDEDLNWLATQLWEAREYQRRVVVTHVPLWAVDGGAAYGTPLHDVLIAGNADWVVTGHWHHGMSDRRDDIEYRIMGPTGTQPYRPGHPESGNIVQYGFMTIDANGLEFSIIPSGAILDSDAFPYEMNQLEWKYQEQTLSMEGFILQGERPGKTGRATLVVKNQSEEEIREKLNLYGGDAGWRVYPREIEVVLRPGQVANYPIRYRVPADGRFFPGPLAEISLPWPQGGEYRLKKELRPTVNHKISVVNSEPVVDGRFDEPFFKGSTVLGPMHLIQGTGFPGQYELRISVVAGERIWIGWRLADPDMEGQYRGTGELLDDYEREDMVALYFDLEPRDAVYGRVVVGASGRVKGDLFGLPSSRGPAALLLEQGRHFRVVRDGAGWQVELALPMALLGDRTEDKEPLFRIGFNLCFSRVRERVMTRACWLPFPDYQAPLFGGLDFAAAQSQTIRP